MRSAPVFLIGFLLLISLSLAVNRYVSRVTAKAKVIRMELAREGERHIVRIAMSKFEVLQNDRIQSEIEISKSIFDKLEPASEVTERYSRISSAIPFGAVDLMRIGLYFAIGYGVFSSSHSIAELVGIIALV